MNLSEMWSEDDLACNRRGEVSPGQRRALLRRWGGRLAFNLVVSAAIITVIVLLNVYDVVERDTIADRALGAPGAVAVWLLGSSIPLVRRLLALLGNRVTVHGGLCDYCKGIDDGERAERIGGHEISTLAPIRDLWTHEVAAYVLPRVKLVIAIEKQ
jgi:hypothetical protein